MELQGTVHTVGQIEEKGSNGFKVAKIILDRTSTFQGQTYANFTEVTFQGAKTEQLAQSQLQPGDFVKINGDIQGRFFTHEGKEKHAQDFVAWKLEVARRKAEPAHAAPQSAPNANPYA